MGRADTARREHVVELGPAFVNGRDDFFANIGNDPCLTQLDTDLVQSRGEEVQVLVLGAARKNFVSDQDQARGNSVFFSHEFFRFSVPTV